jgi:hypothetical protein
MRSISAENPPLTPVYNTTYHILPAPVYMFQSLVNGFIDLHVKTIVAVSMVQEFNPYNSLSCFKAAAFAATRGIIVLAQVS